LAQTRDHADVTGQRLDAPEAGRFAKLGNDARGSLRADAFDGSQQFTHLVAFEPPRDISV